MLSRIINKTPLQNERFNCYGTQIDNQLISKVINSRFIGEGVYCLEQFSMPDYQEQYLISPSFDKFENPITNKQWGFGKEVLVYELVLSKPSFMPLDSKKFIDLFHSMPQLNVFTQVILCKRMDKWRETAISQYESYLKGNDNPLQSKFTIKLQEKVLNVFAKVSNSAVTRKPIEEMEQKILQNNYRFECRFVLYDSENRDIFELEMANLLQKVVFFNEITLKKAQNKRFLIRSIQSRSFQCDLVDQMLSEQEVISLLTDGKVSVVENVQLEQPVKKQSVTKSMEESMLLHRAIQIMPYKEKVNKEVDKSVAQKVNQALKRVGVIKDSLKVTEIFQGSSLLKIQMVVPPSITYTTIKKKLTDIQAALGNENISIEIGSKPDTVDVFIPLQERGVVYFRQVLESEEFKQAKEKYPLPFIIGESVNGELLFGDLADLPHLLVAGATKSGKSVFINLLLLCLLISVPPELLRLYLVDPKQVEYTLFDGFVQVSKIITDMKKADALLGSLVNEMEKRYTMFAKCGVKNIISYNKINEQKLPYLVVAIDEYADLVMVNPNVEDHLVRLGQKARAAGIHLIICTQKPMNDVVTSVLKSNLPSAISFRLKTSADYMTVFGKGIQYNLLGKGDGVSRLEGQYKEFERFQSPILTLDETEEENIYNQLKELFKDVQITDEELPEEEEQIDKLKRIIATKNELRVSELGRLMKIGNNAVADLIKQLVGEEWLVKPGRSYEINVSQEELNKWRE